MLISEKRRNTPKLSREIMGLLCITAAIALFFFGFLYLTANAIASTYLLENDILLTEGQLLTLQGGIRSLSLLSAVLLFLALFLFLLGQKMAYLREIIQGVKALRTHRMDFTMPIEGDNELKELAESINFLSETERRLRQLETELQAEKEQLIRDLSHDIRTPLTAMLSYSDYLGRKETLEQEEVQEYIALVQRKGQQIKALTDRLLDSGSRDLETIEDGKLLMEQLAGEWEEILENTFPCIVDTKNCPAFYGSFDIQELRRIFDNLASNVEKYADREQPVELRIDAVDKRLRVCQRNGIKTGTVPVESNQIGLESIRRIAALYGGMVKVSIEQGIFSSRSRFLRLMGHIFRIFRIAWQISLDCYAMMISEKEKSKSEECIMALGLLLVLFMVMSIISVMGLVLLFLLKGEKGQKAVFYFMAVWGMVIAWMTANSYPTNYIKEQLIAWAFGALAVIALLVQICGKSERSFLTAKVLVAASVVLGMVALFVI